MPHCVIEHFRAFSSDADRDDAMRLALETCAKSDTIARADLKIRCVGADAILFGDGRTSFIHVTLSMLAGRTEQQKVELAEALRDAFRTAHPDVASISIDIRDMDPACYRKSLV